MHGHDWGVAATVTGDGLDADGLLCDFHALEGAVDDAVAPFRNRTLNDVPPFDRVNPTAENLAEFIAMELARRLPRGVRIRRVEVEEAPGCVASWIEAAAVARELTLDVSERGLRR